ncbi:MAG TPA: hypothetical protein VHT04_03385, partial [Stellaceae bacterium]|nr:hypothetical protein [Stellaceae bacterium]
EIGADERRATQRGEDTAFPRLLARYGTAHHGANPCRVGVVFGKTLGQRADQQAIDIKPENLEPSHPALAKAATIVFQRALL